MTPGSWLNALKGIGDEFEITRILGAGATTIYTLATPAFVLIGVFKNVTLTEFSLAYPGGIVGCIGITAGAVAWKDKGVASARVTQQTGAVPTEAPGGAKVPTRNMPKAGKSI